LYEDVCDNGTQWDGGEVPKEQSDREQPLQSNGVSNINKTENNTIVTQNFEVGGYIWSM
jgi:ribosomal protein S11